MHAAEPFLHILIFSGQNNHNWQATTPKLKAILENSGRFAVDVTEHPEQCDAATFQKYDVLLSNWNTFGNPHPLRDDGDRHVGKIPSFDRLR